MANMINICGTNDAFARYKMPRMDTKVEGRGNGVKTVLVNIVDLSKHLHRPPAYTTKYFGCVLGARSNFDEKTGLGVVNGAHDTSALQGLLNGFIKTFVLCEKCQLPETDLKVSKKTDIISAMCRACGHTGTVDPREKLATFIVKNPPKKKGDKGDEAGGKSKKDERAAKKEARRNKDEKRRKKKEDGGDDEDEAEDGEDGDDGNDDDDNDDDNNDGEEGGEGGSNDDEDETAATATEDGPKSPKTLVEEKAAGGSALFKAVEAKTAEPVNKAASAALAAVMASEKATTREAQVQVVRDMFSKGTALALIRVEMETAKVGVAKEDLMDIVFEVLFGAEAKASAEKQVKLLKQFVMEKSHTEVLDGIAKTFATANKEHVKLSAFVFQTIYEEDIIEEEKIIDWYKNDKTEGRDEVRAALKPFIDWLETAEEESD